MPVDAPDGTDARKTPISVVKSTSTVGLPRESRISHARTAVILPLPVDSACADCERQARRAAVEVRIVWKILAVWVE